MAAEDQRYVTIQDLAVGTRVHLSGGRVAEITSNPRDGTWLYVRHVTREGNSEALSSEEDLVFASDVVGIADEGSRG